MKTNFRILTTVFTLAFVGVVNANTTVNFGQNNSGLFPGNENLSVLNEKIASFESDLNENIDYRMEAQMVTRMIADMAEAKANQRVMEIGFVAPQETSNSFENEIVTENSFETTDFAKEAQLMTKLIADQAEEKANQRVMELGFVATQESSNYVENEISFETTDFGKEAQLMTKWIADMAEAKAIQKVMDRGFVAPNETSSSFENEAANETIDFGKEALLITKLIADQEEAKAIQKVMERGFVAPNETSSFFENEIATETTDFGKEALLITKLIADKEEAKVVQELIAEGILEEPK